MNFEKIVRSTLWLSVAFNFFAAYSMAFPSSYSGQLLDLPQNVPVLYAALLSAVVAFFGFVYAWLAWQPTFEKHLLFLGASGKLVFFSVAFLAWLLGDTSGNFALLTAGDLILGSLWLLWLYAHRSSNDA